MAAYRSPAHPDPPNFAIDGLKNARNAIRSAHRFMCFWLIWAIVCDVAAVAYIGFIILTEDWRLLIGAGTFAGLSAAGFLRRETTKLRLQEYQGWRDYWRDYHR